MTRYSLRPTVRLLSLLILALLACFGGSARADFAPDVVVFCEPTLQPLIIDLGTAWRAQSGVRIHVFAAPTRLLLEQVAHGIRADLLIAEDEASATEATTRGLIKPETRFGGWRNRWVVAKRGPSAEPAILSSDADLFSQANALPVALVDSPRGAFGIPARTALENLNLLPAIEPHSIGVASSADAIYLLTHGTVGLAILYRTDVRATPGLSVAATFPDAAAPPITYWGAETHQVLSVTTGQFRSYLMGPEARARLTAAGLELTQ